MKNVYEIISNIWYSLKNSGLGGAIIIWLLCSLVYYFFFSVGGVFVTPVTIIGFAIGFIWVCTWLYKNRK